MDYKYFHLAAMALEACADNFDHPVMTDKLGGDLGFLPR